MNEPRTAADCNDAPDQQKSLTLVANDLAPGEARSFTRDVLTAWQFEDLMDQAVLIVSELTTNAERHGRRNEGAEGASSGSQGKGGEEITLTLAVQADVVTIEVEDNSPYAPVQRAPEQDATSGRGLCLVSAMADGWTTRPTEDGTGKRVLAFISRPEPSVAS
ncbi:ATP-binding protein [Streptomyces stelliscabiei]|uniref:ATP-binding protein n=1 Tax=Streptomyces stelliscabiei TaxID=146820 RepID=UPI0029B79283|nr:ATP-binding protein [Streptomyces stelliscabiei]MDX3435587.1 ATP-binding protein [Streptomyces stelliscabiei]MDX3622114.1 ATP-binding protein [Streptomyces stelliscabiei]